MELLNYMIYVNFTKLSELSICVYFESWEFNANISIYEIEYIVRKMQF